MRNYRIVLRILPFIFAALSALAARSAVAAEQHLLYVASPGIRNYIEYGGVGVLVFDMDHGFKFVKRIATFESIPGKEPEPIKGICANAKTARLYVTTPTRLLCIDLLTDKRLWEKKLEGGCDRMALSPDGRIIYVPSFEGPYWTVVDGGTGAVLARVETKSGSHNTVYGPNGKLAYLAGLKSPLLYVADTSAHKIAQTIGPFSNVIRPLTINGSQSICFVNVNDLLGFEIGDLKTGKMLYRVEVQGYQQGPTKRHGCPSHGVALTPDERELWLTDAHNERLHIFDATSMPPKQTGTIKLRDQPGWISFGIDGRLAFPSTCEIIDVKSRRVVATLTDEEGRAVQSEKLLEIDFEEGRPLRSGNQFGIGRNSKR